MEEQNEINKEIESMLVEKTEAEISMEFLEAYRQLTRKYKRDFMQQPLQIIKLEFIQNPNDTSNNPTKTA